MNNPLKQEERFQFMMAVFRAAFKEALCKERNRAYGHLNLFQSINRKIATIDRNLDLLDESNNWHRLEAWWDVEQGLLCRKRELRTAPFPPRQYDTELVRK